jgi:hypothetical protein
MPNWNLYCVSVRGDILVLCRPKFHGAFNVWILEHFILTDSGNSYVFVGLDFRVLSFWSLCVRLLSVVPYDIRVCSKSKSLCNWRSVSLSVLVSNPVWGSWPDIYLWLESYSPVSMGAPSLTRGRVYHLSVIVDSNSPCHLYNLYNMN